MLIESAVFVKVDNGFVVHPCKNSTREHTVAEDTVFVGVDNWGGQLSFLKEINYIKLIF